MSCLPCHEQDKWRSRISEDEVRELNFELTLNGRNVKIRVSVKKICLYPEALQSICENLKGSTGP